MSKNQTINEALNNLILELTDNEELIEDNEVVTDCIDDLAEALKASVLPEASAAYNGAIMAIVEGKWTLCDAHYDSDLNEIVYTPVDD